MATSCIELDFSDLRGKIKAILGTEGEFAKRIGRTHGFVSSVFNGKAYFDTNDVINAASVLGIEQNDIGSFFYTQKVHKSEQEG